MLLLHAQVMHAHCAELANHGCCVLTVQDKQQHHEGLVAARRARSGTSSSTHPQLLA
jgi:hypothetical protein